MLDYVYQKLNIPNKDLLEENKLFNENPNISCKRKIKLENKLA